MRIKSLLLSGVCVGASALMAASAQAQSSSDLDKVEQMQRQMEQMQDQIKSLKGEVAKNKSIDMSALKGAYGADVPRSKSPLVKAVPFMEHVKLTMGGFFAGETVYRQHNATSDESTSFGSIPFPFSPAYKESEFRGSGRATRITLLAEGNIDPKRKLSGYMETDFFGVGATSNYNQSNSWAPRIRQGYLTYDDNSSGFHFLTGQAWSLLTQNTAGIQPRKENIPLTIEHNYVVGFEFTRNWQARFVQELGPMLSFGVSVEAPAQIVFTGTGSTGAAGVTSGSTLNGFVVNFNNAGGSFLGSSGIANTFTTDTVPDVIEKVAFDPGWAHFELFGIQRFFTDNVFTCSIPCAVGACPLTTANVGTAGTKTTTGAGIGGSFLWPIIPTYLDVSGQAMAGKGVGRYAAGQLSDVVVGPDGSLKPINQVSAMGGLVWHPWMGTDIYAYGGFEKESANFFTSQAGGFLGLGNPNLTNAGCTITTAASFSGGSGLCAQNTKMLTDVTVGIWHNLYNGDIGRFAVGVQWELIGRKLFDGLSATPPATVAPSTTDNIVMTSIRWYPKYQ
jgi:hypothetical protein